MEYKLINQSVDEILSEEEKQAFESKTELLKAGNFKVSMPLKDFFDLVIYHRLIEEKLRDKLFELRLDLIKGGKNAQALLNMNKNMYAKQLVLNKELQQALQREINDKGIYFNVEQKTTALIDALKTEKKKASGRRKQFQEAVQVKEQILSEINEVINGSEPRA